MTKLKDLEGLRLLSGVDRLHDDQGIVQGGDVLRFELDFVTYTAHEDPEDGFRSSMGELLSTDSYFRKPVNTFSPVAVTATHYERIEPHDEIHPDICFWTGECDLLVLRHRDTSKVILAVGTVCTDDLYPSFVAMFDPLALSGEEEPF